MGAVTQSELDRRYARVRAAMEEQCEDEPRHNNTEYVDRTSTVSHRGSRCLCRL